MSEEPLKIVKNAGVLRLTLDRPNKKNAYNSEIADRLMAALDDAAADPEVRVVLLTGAGDAFCSGQDLSDPTLMGSGQMPDLGEVLERTYNQVLRRMRALPKPIICGLNGAAAGAGANLALACDIVMAKESAYLYQGFAKIGLMPDAGGSWLLPRLIGEARAKAICMTGEKVPAKTAAEWGMIYKAVPDEAYEAELSTLVQQMATSATVAIGLAKEAIQDSATRGFEEQIAAECDYQRQAGASPDFMEGVSAFLMKRPPNFKGVR